MYFSGWVASDRYQIDAISISFTIWQIVSQMGTVQTDRFSVLEATHVLPYDFVIPETRPPVSP